MEITIGQEVDISLAKHKSGTTGIVKEDKGVIIKVQVAGADKLIPILRKFIKEIPKKEEPVIPIVPKKEEIKISKIMQVDGSKLQSANKHLLVPLVDGEKVIVLQIGDEHGEQYLKVKHNHGKNVSVFHRSYFIPVKKDEK